MAADEQPAPDEQPVPGTLRPAKRYGAAHLGGYSSRHLTPFEVVASGQYPPPRAGLIRPLQAAVDSVAPPPPVPAPKPPTSVVRPPWWQVAAWSDRPGELMTSSFRVGEMAGDIVGVSAEQSYTLRRSRTATLPGGSVRLTRIRLELPKAWGRFAAAFRPNDLELVQTLVRTKVGGGGVQLYVVADQTVYVGSSGATAAGANPCSSVSGGRRRRCS